MCDLLILIMALITNILMIYDIFISKTLRKLINNRANEKVEIIEKLEKSLIAELNEIKQTEVEQTNKLILLDEFEHNKPKLINKN